MKRLLFGLAILAIGFITKSAVGMSLIVPSPGAMVLQADTIVVGRFVQNGGVQMFEVDRSVKGTFQPTQCCVTLTKYDDDIFFDMTRYLGTLENTNFVVLGMNKEGAIHLKWSSFSIWPNGIIATGLILSNVSSCIEFIAEIQAYEDAAHQDIHEGIRLIQTAIQENANRPAALAYLITEPEWLLENRLLYRDVLSVVAAYIARNSIYDDWTLSCVLSLAPSMPQSIVIPYLMNAPEMDGNQGERARVYIESSLRARKLWNQDLTRESDLSQVLATILPVLRTADARQNVHLFDVEDAALTTFASLVQSEIWAEPRPIGNSPNEEKVFWLKKMGELGHTHDTSRNGVNPEK